MTPRLAAKIQVSALIRLAEARGGTGAVVRRGDADAGAILLILADRGRFHGAFERMSDPSGTDRWRASGPQDIDSEEKLTSYIQRRCTVDSDLWVVELDVAGAERFAAEIISTG